MDTLQLMIFLGITGLVALITYFKCRGSVHTGNTNREYFLAGKGLSWIFIAGSLTLTNISTDTLVGLNGAQTSLVALWELTAVVGMLVLAKVLLPIYYRYKCTTTTELLEKRYNNPNIRTTISLMFLLGNLFIYLPILLFTGSLFMTSLFDIQVPQYLIAVIIAVVGGSYAIFGGLRAVAVSDTFNGIGLLIMGLLVTYLSLAAINFDFSGIPADKLTLIGSNDSDIPWHTLLTGMFFIQIFYWGTNQNITQRALAGKSLKEAQKGVYATAIIRLLIVPPVVVIPGIVAFKLFGDIGDLSYGTIVREVLPTWLSGAFAAVMLGTILSTYNSILNASAALYVCDLHEKHINPNVNVRRISVIISILMVLISLVVLPMYMNAQGIMALMQQLNGLLSMPILSAFITGLLFRNIDGRSIVIAVLFGIGLYALFTWVWTPLHYIHLMFITLCLSVTFALTINKMLFNQKAEFIGLSLLNKEKTETAGES
ncbi:solute:sodium symporter family transporter [Parashewanella spongiae]|uniref:Solute:sodium symporter family transporter n=1 Tax=Parashewanella spongiae TaxID=342950 RepID=A0A3A6TD90_9GAMM|nr:solute:sodium symporter family transporter [Parashewanella spongiae]MCL1079112.1 solute:sodium symporter family transporter [Parashewanella spongiae]RJY10729.1 solute:sodium symporter family transporter [Parashewanella spongiae]